MKRAGILNALEKKHYPQRMNKEPEKPSSVTFKRARVFFFLLGTGIILAVLILILEIAVYRRKWNKRTEHRRKQNKRNAKTKLVWKEHPPPARPLSSDRQEK
jgi:uncharacterized membrane protein YozB (DUF420 family)